jgi:hypothetical protein
MRITLIVTGLNEGLTEYANTVSSTVELNDDGGLTVFEMADRLVDVSKAVLLAMTYQPSSVAEAFEGYESGVEVGL